jgi:hypothetical protein
MKKSQKLLSGAIVKISVFDWGQHLAELTFRENTCNQAVNELRLGGRQPVIFSVLHQAPASSYK